jgi:hypothetical protein
MTTLIRAVPRLALVACLWISGSFFTVLNIATLIEIHRAQGLMERNIANNVQPDLIEGPDAWQTNLRFLWDEMWLHIFYLALSLLIVFVGFVALDWRALMQRVSLFKGVRIPRTEAARNLDEPWR